MENDLGKIKSRQEVKTSSRFKTEHVVTEKGDLFLKTTLKPEFDEKIKHQVDGIRAYTRLSQNVDWLKVEKLVANGKGWLATEWLGGKALATQEQFLAGQNLGALDDYAKVAAKLDEIAEANLPETSNNQIILGRHSLEPKTYSQGLHEKFEPFASRPDFDQGLIKAGIDYFEQIIGDFQASWQHGDLTPWHIFKDGQNLVLIDCEHVRNTWPRYYDLANFYSQLHVRFGMGEQAGKMIENFNEARSQEATKSKSFWGMAVVRTLRRSLEHEDNLEMVERAFQLVAKIVSA
jgi:hypothetical protein